MTCQPGFLALVPSVKDADVAKDDDAEDADAKDADANDAEAKDDDAEDDKADAIVVDAKVANAVDVAADPGEDAAADANADAAADANAVAAAAPNVARVASVVPSMTSASVSHTSVAAAAARSRLIADSLLELCRLSDSDPRFEPTAENLGFALDNAERLLRLSEGRAWVTHGVPYEMDARRRICLLHMKLGESYINMTKKKQKKQKNKTAYIGFVCYIVTVERIEL